MIQIGNQTSFAAPTPTTPFEFALAEDFDAFEWFPDKKPGAGWDEHDLPPAERRRIRAAACARGLRMSVHARWEANPLQPACQPLFWNDIEMARDLGAVLLNIHLFHERGIMAFIEAIAPLLRRTAEAGLELAIENTPLHPPEAFNELFARLGQFKGAPTLHAGMCLDIGHANLCLATRHRYLDFVDRLGPHVPITHVHLHENWGDADSHLALFTGPAARDDAGVRGLLTRLQKRRFSGSFILEQWPEPPTLLRQACDRLRKMLHQEPPGTRTSHLDYFPSREPAAAEKAEVLAEEEPREGAAVVSTEAVVPA